MMRASLVRQVEAALTPTEREAVAGLVRTLAVASWAAVPALRVVLRHVAVARLAAEYQRVARCTEGAARATACARLGVNQATYLRRRRRWIEAALLSGVGS